MGKTDNKKNNENQDITSGWKLYQKLLQKYSKEFLFEYCKLNCSIKSKNYECPVFQSVLECMICENEEKIIHDFISIRDKLDKIERG